MTQADEKVTPEERAVTVASYIVSTAPHIDGPKADAQHIADKIAAEIRAAEQAAYKRGLADGFDKPLVATVKAARAERDREWCDLLGVTSLGDAVDVHDRIVKAARRAALAEAVELCLWLARTSEVDLSRDERRGAAVAGSYLGRVRDGEIDWPRLARAQDHA